MITEVIQTHAKTTNPITIVEEEYTFRVVGASISEKFEITQKYESFACDTIIEPAPIESIVSNLPHSESRPRIESMGATKEAVVIIATVEDP
jgi:hypothetical protein